MKQMDPITAALMNEFPDDTEAYRDLNADFRSILADWYRRDAFRMGRMWMRLRELCSESFRSVKSSEQITQDILERIPEEKQVEFIKQHPDLMYSLYSVSNGIHGCIVRLISRMISDNNVDLVETILQALDKNSTFRYTDPFFDELLHYPFSSFTMPIQSMLIRRGGARIRSMVEEAAYRSRRVQRNRNEDRIPQMIRIGMQYKDRGAAQFIAQTRYMEGYAAKEVPEVPWNSFSIALPTYSGMSHSQLEWYFYWVSELRQGRYRITSPEYGYLYAFTLMNGLEVANIEDAFDKLCLLYEKHPDYHLQEWIHDYAVYYKIPVVKLKRFLERAGADATFQLSAAAKMIENPQEDTALELALHIAEMPVTSWKKKEYYLELCKFFSRAVKKVQKAYEEHSGKSFMDIWTGKPYPKVWNPGEGIPVAYPEAVEGEERRVNAYESYRYLNHRWVGWHYYGADRKWIHRLLNMIDMAYRRYAGISGRQRSESELELWLVQMIDREAREYVREKKKLRIDMTSLAGIRSKADTLTERLIIEEAEIEEGPQMVQEEEEPGIFTKEEEQVLRYLLDGAPDKVYTYARSHGTLPQVLYESINEKALEWMEDILIEDGVIFDEYRDAVEAYLQQGG